MQMTDKPPATWQSLVASWPHALRAQHRAHVAALVELGYSESIAGLLAWDRMAGEEESEAEGMSGYRRLGSARL